MNINIITLGGNLTRDPETRVTPQGTAIAQFSIANNRKFKDASGQMREEVSFIDCEAWGKTGENIGKFFSKGDRILVAGRIKQDSWEDKQTQQKRTKLKVVVDQFHFVDSKRDRAPDSAPNGAGQGGARPSQNLDEDVPFAP